VRKNLRKFLESHEKIPELLDVGGRTSPYTIGLSAIVTLTDIPQSSKIQADFGLGLLDDDIERIKKRRSNIREIVFDDMVTSKLSSSQFDFVTAIEVLEHVKREKDFLSNVARVLKPDGVFVMSTPNGDFIKNRNPNHVRHYKKRELESLLSNYFENVNVYYSVYTHALYKLGLPKFSLKHPLRTLLAVISNVVNNFGCSRQTSESSPIGYAHLIAIASKS
jgi:ubiquinone/menaquinone biosynthesis C-methylase UbiE